MDTPLTFKRKGVFPFLSLPVEVRLMVHYFLVVEPRPLPLLRSSRRNTDENALCTYAIPKDLRMLYTRKEVYAEMNDLIYSEICFSYSTRIPEVEEGTEAFRVDLTRIQKLYICVADITGWPYESDEDEGIHSGGEPEYCDGYYDFRIFVSSLAFGGHQLKNLLIECEPQERNWLGEGLSPLGLLRNIRLVHFRAGDATMHVHLRVLENIMMSDQPMEFSNLMDFVTGEGEYCSLIRENPENGLVEYLDTTTSVVVKSEAQMEATARELYSTLGMGREFVAQSDLDGRWFSGKESTWSVWSS